MNIVFNLIYSLPAILVTLFCYEASRDKKNIENDNIIMFIITGVVCFLFVFASCGRDLAILGDVTNYSIKENIIDNLYVMKGLFKFELLDLMKLCFLNIVIFFGKIRFSKDYKTMIIEMVISFLLTIVGVNSLYVMLFLFIKFTLTYANNSKIYDMIFQIFYFVFGTLILPNSYIFCMVLFISLFKNCKKIEEKHIFIYDRYKWMEVEKNMKELTNISYLFIYFKDKLSKREVKEFLLFLDNISYNNNVIRVHDDLFAVAFSEIDKSFGYSDEVVNQTLRSEIETVEDMVRKRLNFALVEEEHNVYTFITFQSRDYYYYRKFREANPDKEKLFSSKSILMNRLNRE